MDEHDRTDLVQAAARELNMPEAVIEKDFWVCHTLDHLFHACSFKDSIIFKGGTSLSKAYGLIDRFSEDIDLILDWRLIGYGLNEPWEKRSNTKSAREGHFEDQSPEIGRNYASLTSSFAR